MRLLTAALAILTGFLPHALHSQDRADEAAHRNECRLAHQVLVHGQPANKYHWALEVIDDCGTLGADAMAHELRDVRALTRGRRVWNG